MIYQIVHTKFIGCHSIGLAEWFRCYKSEESKHAFILFQDLAGILSDQWEEVEKAYVSGSKEVFHCVREERERIIRYFFRIRCKKWQRICKEREKKLFVSHGKCFFTEGFPGVV